MAQWWYITIHRCPDCGAKYEVYDSSGPWCDSGLSTCPVVEERCPDCWQDLEEDETELKNANH